jgi:hypothetical protein
MNAVMERWVRTCRRELLDRTLTFNPRHLLHVLRQYEVFYNKHRPHQGIANARPLALLPEPITDPDRIAHLNIHRRDRLCGTPPRIRACCLIRPDGILGSYRVELRNVDRQVYLHGGRLGRTVWRWAPRSSSRTGRCTVG